MSKHISIPKALPTTPLSTFTQNLKQTPLYNNNNSTIPEYVEYQIPSIGKLHKDIERGRELIITQAFNNTHQEGRLIGTIIETPEDWTLYEDGWLPTHEENVLCLINPNQLHKEVRDTQLITISSTNTTINQTAGRIIMPFDNKNDKEFIATKLRKPHTVLPERIPFELWISFWNGEFANESMVEKYARKGREMPRYDEVW